MADNFLNNVDEPTANYVDQLVGEGKKYKDVEELAKAYAHANNHIKNVEGDNASLRTEFEAFRDFATAQLTKTNPLPSNPPLPDQNEQNRQPEPAAAVPPNGDEGAVDLDARIAKMLDEKDEQKRMQGNADLAQEAMVKHFGSQEAAVKAINDRANELGVSAQWLANTAFQSPKAFFASMGLNPDIPVRSTSTPASASDVNVQRLADVNPGVKPGTYAYYQELRKKNPSLYFSNKIQQEIMQRAMDEGSANF